MVSGQGVEKCLKSSLRTRLEPYLSRPGTGLSVYALHAIRRERQRVVIRPLAGARGYRNVQSSKDVGINGGRSEGPKDAGNECARSKCRRPQAMKLGWG